MINIEQKNGPAWSQLTDSKNQKIKIGIIKDRPHPGTLDEAGPKSIAQVAHFVETGGKYQYIMGKPIIRLGAVSPVKPRPFLKKGVNDIIQKNPEKLKAIPFGDSHKQAELGEILKHSVIETMRSYDGDPQTKAYITKYKQQNPDKRLFRTGTLTRSIDYKWDSH